MKIARENGCRNVSQIEPHFSSRFIVVLPFYGTDHPAISGLISDAGIKGQAVVTTGRCAAGVRLQHLRHTGHGIATCSQLCCVGNGIACAECVNLSKMVVDAAIVPGNTHIAVPNAGITEMPRPLFQSSAVCAFINSDS